MIIDTRVILNERCPHLMI